MVQGHGRALRLGFYQSFGYIIVGFICILCLNSTNTIVYHTLLTYIFKGISFIKYDLIQQIDHIQVS